MNTNEVLSIDFGRFRTADDDYIDGQPPTCPTPDPQEGLQLSGRARMAPPMRSYDYLPELMAKDAAMAKPRTDLKPLYVVQPEGVSYTLRGNEISWQKWNFHIGFHPRDGLVISTVTYNDGGEVRPLFYRLSVAEMVVPYADTCFPHPRKFAFDVGEYGMGTQANSLKIGCDCLGTISYLDGSFVGLDGQPITIEQCICIHEEGRRPGIQAHRLPAQWAGALGPESTTGDPDAVHDCQLRVHLQLQLLYRRQRRAPGPAHGHPQPVPQGARLGRGEPVRR
ncbi:hypothetical protein L7F22_038337 [Adiantum nelumboides]|nr:hypothetical protein [Adiantum nelumboides]